MNSSYVFPSAIDRYLAVLGKLYLKNGQKQLHEIIVNSQPRLVAGWSHDNWDGGITGHMLYLQINDDLYLDIFTNRTEIEGQITKDINEVNTIPNEFIDHTRLDPMVSENQDWRVVSGRLRQGHRIVSEKEQQRIWGNSNYRIFISHKAEFKKDATDLKEVLRKIGVSAFVAHEDIHPNQEWVDEILKALASMDALVALITPEFSKSAWTNQEIGYALGRGIPTISIRFGNDPDGFTGRFQALSIDAIYNPYHIAKLLVEDSRMVNALILSLPSCRRFDDANIIARLFPLINQITDQQIETLLLTFNTNIEVNGAYGFNGKDPKNHGPGLAAHLSRWTGRNYALNDRGEIELLN